MFVGGKLDAATQTYMGGELEAATKVLADAIVEGEKAVGKENAGILWLRNLLAEAEQNSVKKWVCCHANFSLRAALVNNSSLYTRLTLIENTKMVQEELYRKAPDDEQAARDLSISYSNLGKIQLQLGNPPEALAYFKKYNAMCEELYRKAPDDARAARDLSVSYDNLGNIQLQLGNPPEALAYYQKYNAMCEELYRKAPDYAQAARDIAVSYYNLASFCGQQKRNQEANQYWALCKDAILYMKQRKMFVDPPIEGLLKQIERMGI